MSHEHCRNFVSLAILVTIILLPNACAPPQRGQAQAGKIAQVQIGKLDPRYRGDLALSPDGKTLALLMDKHGVELWDLGTGNSAIFPNPPGEDSGGGSATKAKDRYRAIRVQDWKCDGNAAKMSVKPGLGHEALSFIGLQSHRIVSPMRASDVQASFESWIPQFLITGG